MDTEIPAIGIIGGSGLYHLPDLASVEEVIVDTPFGVPSDALMKSSIAGRCVYFLPRHARGHRILPHELNHRANIFALRSLNVRWIISVSAVGSLQERYAPRDIVLPTQFYDRTSQRNQHTFFGDGIAVHVSMADPVSAGLRAILKDTIGELGYALHDGGTYINMDGPAFSTRAESEIYRKLGCDIIGMTGMGEAKLAREAEIAFATVAMVTDYDCWKVEEEAVTVEAVIANLMANVDKARKIIAHAIGKIPTAPQWPEHRALDNAILTERALWPEATCQKLSPILGRFLEKSRQGA